MLDSRDINLLHWKVRKLCLQHIENCKKRGVKVIVISTVRDNEYQEKLYNQGRTTKGSIVTNVKIPTFHGYGIGLAYDLVPVVNGKAVWNDNKLWDIVMEEGKALGLTVGGYWTSFVDKPHFQLDEGLKSSDIRKGKRPSWFYDKEDKIVDKGEKPMGQPKVMQETMKMNVLGKEISVSGINISGSFYCPLRSLFEQLGLEVEWTPEITSIKLK